MDVRTVCLIAVIAVWPIKGQQPSAPLRPPFGPANQLASPDGAYALFGNEKAAQLWLDDTHRHQRMMVAKVTVQTLTLSWSPDSAAFILNDRAVSNLEISYIYDVKTLNRLDLRSRILAADPEGARFVQSENSALSYFHAIRWLDARHVEVQLHGFTGGTRTGTTVRPGDCFDFRYRAGKDGGVQRLSHHVSAISDKTGCKGLE
jgi:hypothetical protein